MIDFIFEGSHFVTPMATCHALHLKIIFGSRLVDSRTSSSFNWKPPQRISLGLNHHPIGKEMKNYLIFKRGCVVLSMETCHTHFLWKTSTWDIARIDLKGSFTIFLFSVRSNILNSNGVWYSWFCPEGPINASNSKFLFFYFVPRDLDSQRHMGAWLAAQGTLTRSAMGP